MNRLQSVLNAPAHLVYKSRKYDHVSRSHVCYETCTGCRSLNAFSFDWSYKFTIVDITWRLCISPMICTGLMSRKHPSDCDLAPVKGSSYREPDYAPSATGHLKLQPRACGTVCRPLSLQPAHTEAPETVKGKGGRLTPEGHEGWSTVRDYGGTKL